MPDLLVSRQILAGEEALEGLEVLGGEDFGGGHQYRLMSSADGGEHGGGGDHGLAGADIALEQAGHWLAAEHVVADFGEDSLLGGGQFEGQRLDELVEEVAGHGDRRGVGAESGLALATEHGELDREQFLKGDAFSGGVDVFHAVGEVDHAQGVGFGGEALLGDDAGRERFGEQGQVIADGGVGESADGAVGQAFRHWVKRHNSPYMNLVIVGSIEYFKRGRLHSQSSSYHGNFACESNSLALF